MNAKKFSISSTLRSKLEMLSKQAAGRVKASLDPNPVEDGCGGVCKNSCHKICETQCLNQCGNAARQ